MPNLTIMIPIITLIAGALAVPQKPIGYWEPPSVESGAQVARTLVHRESLANINTVDRHGVPVSSMEYYVDCDGSGDPYWLVVNIGSPFQNIKNGLSLLWSIRVGDHPAQENVDVKYPGGIERSPAGQPRLNLFGELVNITGTKALEACFLQRHPDSKWWLPSLDPDHTPHLTHWVQLKVDRAYLVGGFGDRAYIGEIDDETYHRAGIL